MNTVTNVILSLHSSKCWKRAGFELTCIPKAVNIICILSELPNVERYSRMYYDLSINMEGIDAIHHLLERMEDMRHEMRSLRKQLLLYREREIEDMDW